MRRKLAIGTLSLMVLVGTAVIVWGQDGGPQGLGGGQGQHQWGGQQHFGQGGPGRGGDGQKWGDGERWGGHRMGMHEGQGFRGGMHHGGMGGGMMRLADNPRVRQYLGLTDDQVSRLRHISTQSEITAVQTRAQMEVNHIELRQMMQADSPDQSAIMAKLDEINSLQGKMEKQRVQTMFDARGVLTADQITKVKTFMEHRGEGMGHGPDMQRRGGPGGWQQHRPGGAPGTPHPNPSPSTPPSQP